MGSFLWQGLWVDAPTRHTTPTQPPARAAGQSAQQTSNSKSNEHQCIKSKHPGPEREDCKHQRSSMERRGRKLIKGRNSKHSAEASKISQCHQTTHRDIFLEQHPCGLRLAWVAFLRLVSKRQQGHLIAGGTGKLQDRGYADKT